MSPNRQDAVDALHSAALHLVRVVASRDTEMGLSPARASVLSILVFGGPRSVGELAKAERVRSPTMSGLIDGLEEAGLARRRRPPGDGRRVVVEGTPAATKLLKAGRARRVELLESLLSDLSDRDVRTLRRAASIVEGALASHLGPATGLDT